MRDVDVIQSDEKRDVLRNFETAEKLLRFLGNTPETPPLGQLVTRHPTTNTIAANARCRTH
ncbi:hypothetical protein RSSM_03985 [Rhodopirellula sallentina SM41]|uniref:Uncharacterized protein n=1 Tax=Rhodopirellula sallentina SM41 TaxID=1263870 RepID=M5TZQ1_9BACT|nr:hypothetical protein RSSM_03985 [Rhodopirellula sallentina SM41]